MRKPARRSRAVFPGILRAQGTHAACQQTEITRMHATGEYTIADLMETFSVGRPGGLGGVLYALVRVPGIVVALPE
jgi:hypothetical protein